MSSRKACTPIAAVVLHGMPRTHRHLMMCITPTVKERYPERDRIASALLPRGESISTTNQLRVITTDVGGGFGPKGALYRIFLRRGGRGRRLASPSNGSKTAARIFCRHDQERDRNWDVEIAVDKEDQTCLSEFAAACAWTKGLICLGPHGS